VGHVITGSRKSGLMVTALVGALASACGGRLASDGPSRGGPSLDTAPDSAATAQPPLVDAAAPTEDATIPQPLPDVPDAAPGQDDHASPAADAASGDDAGGGCGDCNLLTCTLGAPCVGYGSATCDAGNGCINLCDCDQAQKVWCNFGCP
jgi:hypothetical protein